MKNQYFGDVNDYYKYAILRAIAAQGLKIQVAWTLTEDGGTHGIYTKYLKNPGDWRHHDPELFDFLKARLDAGDRRVAALEESGLIPGAVFTSDLIPVDPELREQYFLKLRYTADKQVIFLDPDTGIAGPSQAISETRMPAYVRLAEITRMNRDGFSLLIYQHMPLGLPNSNREGYLRERAEILLGCTKTKSVVAFTAPRVTFLLVVHERHGEGFERAAEAVECQWQGKLRVDRYAPS